MEDQKYVIITSARNEEAYIKKTIESVIRQTILPKRWVIVSDGSTDRTDEIVRRFEASYDFIQLLRTEHSGGYSFASKAHAIRAGLAQLNDIEYNFIGNLDADISFEPSYYETVLAKFKENSKLGITGGVIFEDLNGKLIRQFTRPWSVAGAIQMFRRQCYEDIGGYIPLPGGGIDVVAEIMARMQGWEVRCFPEIKTVHNRYVGKGKNNILVAKFRFGRREYSYGNHPLYEIAKCLLRVGERPYVIGSFLRGCGYFLSFLHMRPHEVPNEVVEHLRREQIQRLLSVFRKKRN